jgi:hypothetical protein
LQISFRAHIVPLTVVLSTFAMAMVLPHGGQAQTTTATATGLTPRQVVLRLTNAASEGSGVSNVGEVIADLVGLEVSTAPIGSSAGGFTFEFDPVTRAFSRAAPSFGPMLGERAITAGVGRASVGVNVIHVTYDTIDGIDLRDGSLETVVLKAGATPLVPGRLRMSITTDTAVAFANIALNRWFDVSVAVPYVSLRLDGAHQIADQIASGSASAHGLGDVALRSKIRLYTQDQGGVALGVDLRLPTGDQDAMLGGGVSRTLVSGIWSTTVGAFAPHASLGFEYWSHPFQIYDPLVQAPVDAGRHGVAYTAGAEWAATDRLTVNGEVIGRTLQHGGRLDYRDVPARGNAFGITSVSVASVDPRGLHRASLAGGFKWNVSGTALITASLLVPLNDAGLRDRITPVVGVDLGF